MFREYVGDSRNIRKTFPFALVLIAALAIAAYAFFQVLAPAGAASAMLSPSSDKTNTGAWTNNSAALCNGTPVTTCSARIDEDIDTPNDADYIQSPADTLSAQVEFELLNPPFNTSAISDLNVRYRAYASGTKASTVRVQVLDQSNTVIGVAPVQAITGSATTYSYNIGGLNLTQAEGDHLYIRITGTTAGAGTSTRVVVTDVNLDTTHTTIQPNPTLAQTCGIDIALVIDTSGSIDSSELQMMKDAYNDFVDALLPGTPTNIAIVDFDTDATVTQGFTDDPALLHAAINAATPDGLTNWEDAIRDARNLFPHRNDKPDLIVFASDGDPNTVGSNGSTALVGENPAVHAAITQADLAKQAGIRMLGLAVGSDPEISNFESITGAGAVTSTNFGDLGDDLFDIAAKLCGGTISVNKLIDADGNPATTGDQTSQSGWTFTANVTSAGDSSTPPSGPTDGTGYILFDISLGGDAMADVDIVETVQAGYALIDAECHAFGNGGLGTWSGNAVNGIHLTPADIVLCTFINSVQETFTVEKDFQPDSAASVTVGLTCANGIVATVDDQASEGDPAEFTVTGYSGDPNCIATETIPPDYDSTGTCSAALSVGTCEIFNQYSPVLSVLPFTVNKDFTDDNPADVGINLVCSPGTVQSVDDGTASESDPAEFTVEAEPGTTCTATENAIPGYDSDNSGCVNVPLTTGNCTIVNEPSPPAVGGVVEMTVVGATSEGCCDSLWIALAGLLVAACLGGSGLYLKRFLA